MRPVRGADLTPEIHTLEEAATILRVKKSWLERQAAARKIPFTMLGGSYHFTTAHLAAIVRLHERPAAAPSTNKPAAHRQPPRQSGNSAGVKPLRPRPRSGPQSAA